MTPTLSSECSQTSFLLQRNAPRISRSSDVAPLPASRMRSASSVWQAKMMWSNSSCVPVAVTSIALSFPDETACTGVARCSRSAGNRESIESTYFLLQKKTEDQNQGSSVKIPYLPPLKVSHGSFLAIRKRLWLCRKVTTVLIGKSVAVTSGGVLQNAAVMGYNN